MRMGMARWTRLWPAAASGGGLGMLLAPVAEAGAARRLAAVAGGLALLAGSAWKRFGTFEAGVASAKNPKYVVVPQCEGLEAADGERHQPT
jgi:hypothetical protein